MDHYSGNMADKKASFQPNKKESLIHGFLYIGKLPQEKQTVVPFQ